MLEYLSSRFGFFEGSLYAWEEGCSDADPLAHLEWPLGYSRRTIHPILRISVQFV